MLFLRTRRSTCWICVVFWLLIAAVATVLTAWQVTIAIMQYLDYGVSTRNAVSSVGCLNVLIAKHFSTRFVKESFHRLRYIVWVGSESLIFRHVI